MTDKFEEVPLDKGTDVLVHLECKLGDYDILYEKWIYSGVWAESFIFVEEDLKKMDDVALERLVRTSPMVETNSTVTISRTSPGFVFVNFNFNVSDDEDEPDSEPKKKRPVGVPSSRKPTTVYSQDDPELKGKKGHPYVVLARDYAGLERRFEKLATNVLTMMKNPDSVDEIVVARIESILKDAIWCHNCNGYSDHFDCEYEFVPRKRRI